MAKKRETPAQKVARLQQTVNTLRAKCKLLKEQIAFLERQQR